MELVGQMQNVMDIQSSRVLDNIYVNTQNLLVKLEDKQEELKQLLQSSSHRPGPGCVCQECEKLKDLESKWIHRLGTLHGNFGLNNRLELNSQSRSGY